MTQKKNVTWFLVLTVAISWPLFLLPLVLPGSAIVAWMLAMFAPGLSAIAVSRYVAREPLATLNLMRLGPKRFYLWAWLLPPLLAVVTLGFTVLLGVGQLDTSFSAISAALPAEAAGVPTWLIVLGQVVAAVALAPVINVVLGSMGEELGWRGFLLPRLLEIGKWRAILLSSVIWGLWHAPVILQGHNYPQNPVLGVFLMVVWCVLLGFFMSWLYLATRSPWAPALAHGAVNATAGLPMMFLLPGINTTWGGTLVSVSGWFGLAAVVLWLVLSHRVPTPEKAAGRAWLRDDASATKSPPSEFSIARGVDRV
jgi:uncharacterized protein